MEGEVQVSEFLKKDITIRIISVLIAVVLWFFVMDIDNPVGSVSVTVPLKVINEDSLVEKGIILKNKDYTRSIEIFIKGRVDRINNLTANEFEAVLDFSKVQSADEKSLAIDGPVYVGNEDTNNFQIWDIRPGSSIKLDMERKERNPFRVEVITTGTVKENYKIIKTTVNPEIMPLEGTDSLIKSVAAIRTIVDIENLDRDLIIEKQECKVYNKNNEEIKQLSKNLYVDIKVEVAKEVPVAPIIKGTPAKNFIEGTPKVRPEKVLITGAPDILAKVVELKTEVLDIEDKNASMDVARRIVLPNGVKLAEGEREEAVVSIPIEQVIEKEIIIDRNNIVLDNTEIDNSLKYSIIKENINVKVKGNKEDIERMDVVSMKPRIDVANIGEGSHSLPLRVTLPEDVRLAGEIIVDVKVEKR